MIFRYEGVTYYNGEVYQGEKYITIMFMLNWFNFHKNNRKLTEK